MFLGVTLARIPPFQQAFLSQPDGLESVQEACVFTGPPSPMFGDVPWFGMWKQMAEREIEEARKCSRHVVRQMFSAEAMSH